MREFLYVDDMAAASVYVMNLDLSIYRKYTKPMLSHINVGVGSDISIKDLALKVAATIGYEGEINFDTAKPDGSPKKLMSSNRLNAIGWQPKINLDAGLKFAYDDFLQNKQRRN